jgi:hypothetical protein
MRVGELLRPISWAMVEELLRGDYLQADAMRGPASWLHQGRRERHPARSSRDPLYRRNLSSVEDPHPRLPSLDFAGLGKPPDQSDRRAHAHRLARPKLTAEIWR